MHTITIPQFSASGGTLAPGTHLCEDVNAWEFALNQQADRPSTNSFVWPKPGMPRNGTKILIIANLAFGDCILFTPVVRELKHRFPLTEIHLCCPRDKFPVFLGLRYVSGFVEYPPRLEVLTDYETVLFTEHAVEHNLLARSQHMTDRFARHLGLEEDWTTDKKPEILLSSEEYDWVKKSFPRTGRRRLGVQVQAGTRSRSYPMPFLFQATRDGDKSRPPMVKHLIDEGWEIGLLGRPGEFGASFKAPEISDLSWHGLSFRQSAAYITTCDCVLAPDSSLMHVAGALDVPCVALFGPFPWQLRTAYYTSVHALQGDRKCPKAPCFHTHHNGLPIFPVDGPCITTGLCQELVSITPDRIHQKINQVARQLSS